jgi:hypothetical protein
MKTEEIEKGKKEAKLTMVFAKKLLRCKCKKIILNIDKIMLEYFSRPTI